MLTADCVVIGGGIVGTAVAFEVAKRKRSVILIEKGDIGGGSTSASSSCIRQMYSTREAIALAFEGVRTWQHWREHLEAPQGEQLAEFVQCGALFLIDGSKEDRIVFEMMRSLGVRCEWLEGPALWDRFPFFDFSRLSVSHGRPHEFHATGERIRTAIYEEEGGFVLGPDLAARNLMSAAERLGATALRGARVTALRREAGLALRVVTDREEEISAACVVNAAGPWSAEVNSLADCRSVLATRPARHQVFDVPAPRSLDLRTSRIPIVGDLTSGIYFRPEPRAGVFHLGSLDRCDDGDFVDPDKADLAIDQQKHRERGEALLHRIPDLGLPLRGRGVAGLYDVCLQDGYPILDATEVPGYYVAIGTSGAWFKGGPVLGFLMAELICEGRREVRLPRTRNVLDLSFFRRDRPAVKTVFDSGVIG